MRSSVNLMRAATAVGIVLLLTSVPACNRHSPPAGGIPTARTGATRYQCPMHPAIVRDKPGSCPVCGMDLVPMADHDATASTSAVPGLATVAINTEVRQRMGLKLGTVERRLLTGVIHTSARIEADETRLYRVTAKIEGWVDKLFVATTGQAVEKGAPLLSVYSPDLVTAQAEYLSALAAHRSTAGNNLPAASRQRLEFWDISDEQIDRLEKTGDVEKYLTLYAPAGGNVTERMVLPGQKIMPGEALMVISDLKEVWADADIYQSDMPYVKADMPVEVTLPYWPGQVFTGNVSFLSPTLDPATGTLKARLAIHNPDLLLKPGMFASATLMHELGDKLAVPTTAVIFTGERIVAFHDTGDGHLVPVELRLGARCGDYYELLAGLSDGDRVVVSANFLVDSESSMKAALESLTGRDNSGNEAPAEHAVQ